MNALNKITIKSRMILSFAIMVVLFAIFGVVSINEMGVLANLTSTLYEHPFRVSNAALKASMDVIKIHRNMKDVALSISELELQEAIQAVRTEEEHVYHYLGIVKKQILGSEGKELEREARKAFSDWKRIRDEAIGLVLKGDKDAASLITKGKGADHVILLERKMLELTSYARNKADGFMSNAEEMKGRIFRNTTVFIIVVILFSIFITYFMTTSILSSVSALKDTMSEITVTGKLTKSDMTGNNEITEMSRHFNGLIEKLQGQFWLRDGQNSLNKELSGELTYGDIVTRSINFVSRYVDACTGALYSYNKDRSLCELKSSFAFVERKYLSNEFKLGEGIVGQVAVEKKPILLRNITSEKAVGQTGTVSEPPKNIYAIPLFYEEKVYGVLEVASFEGIDDIKKEFLDSASKAISVSLYTSAQHEQIKELLESTQEANNKLQAQSEELEAQTEELQSQTEELEAQSEELHSTNEELQQQSEELQEQNVELENQRRQVEETNRLKSEFLSNMSHELRTPLNSVLALSRVLIVQAKEKLSEEETNYLKIIERNGKQLLALINDILDLSKIEAGKMDFSPGVFSIKSTIEAIFESLEPVAKAKGIEIIQNIPVDLPRIESDESRVHQILQNIIGNGVKFTEQGNVTVSASSDAEKVYVKVEDTGIGISDKDMPYIFDEFRQVNGSLSRPFEGTGLGLAIVYRAIKKLGGDISVESVHGKGSTFMATLPIKREGSAEIYELFNARPPVETVTGVKKTVLVVDDDPGVVAMISEYLAGEGYNTITATSGREALKIAETHCPFAITLDVIMSGMDGFEVLDRIRRNPETANLPVIIVTAKDLIMEDRKRLEGRVSSILTKSDTTSKALLEEIKKILTKIEGHLESPKDKRVGKGKRILLVEDNESAVIQVKSTLEKEGFTIDVARDGEKALDYVKKTIPDGIILDLMIPGVDGFEVLEKIRSTEVTARIPVLILTAKDLTPDDFKRLKSNKIQQLIQKGDVDREVMLLKTKIMMGLTSEEKTEYRDKKKTKPTILVVEDNRDNRIAIKAVLKDRYKIIEAVDGKEGVKTALAKLPDLVLLDMSLPHMDGFEVVRKIKADEKARRIPVIALTSRAMKGDREKTIAAGCDDYISKPIDPEGISKKIDEWI